MNVPNHPTTILLYMRTYLLTNFAVTLQEMGDSKEKKKDKNILAFYKNSRDVFRTPRNFTPERIKTNFDPSSQSPNFLPVIEMAYSSSIL